MEVLQKGSLRYDDYRRISNARFDYEPRFICLCGDAYDVREALALRKKYGLKLRVRSGGHHHEGMSSGGQDVLVIDLRLNDTIFIDSYYALAWLGTGAKLEDVYARMWKERRLFPGGGCGDVRVGGLVQGGGWGPYARALGLTCDMLMGVRMVKTDGEIIEATVAESNPHHELLKAIRGGGGGNFGIITDFLFKLGVHDDPISDFTVYWNKAEHRGPVVEQWRQQFPKDTSILVTSFARLTYVEDNPNPDKQDRPVIVAGFYLGNKQDCESHVRGLLGDTYKLIEKAEYNEKPPSDGRGAQQPQSFQHPAYQPGPPAEAARAVLMAMGEPDPPDLTTTCGGQFFPHKVSSCYPADNFGLDAVKTIADFFMKSVTEPGSRRYLSLHCLGGNVKDGGFDDTSTFAFRKKPFMLQYQAWWADPKNDELSAHCMAWVKAFRVEMQRFTEGSFINFPDYELVDHPNTREGRIKLLEIYYKDQLKKLMNIKYQYDKDNLLDFPMGILPEASG